MNLIWTGSDVLYVTDFPRKFRTWEYVYCLGYRLFVRIADLFVQKHIVVSDHLKMELGPLHLKKPIEVCANPVKYMDQFPKIPHENFNVLYYLPHSKKKPFRDWVYGRDIMEQVEREMPHINIIRISGGEDMAFIFPSIDFYARPNRHDGNPRLIRECQIQEIPYYHSYRDPAIKDLKNLIQYYYDKKMNYEKRKVSNYD